MNKKTGIIIAVASAVILAVVIIILSMKLRQSHEENAEMVQLFELEKEEMESEYSNFANQYDEMQVMISNDSLMAQLEREKQRTQRLLEELRNTKATDAAEITRLKKELQTVKAVMRSYVVQIDSLNRANEKLHRENTRVRQQIEVATQQISTLEEEKKNLSDKVTLASQLDATGIRVAAHSKRGKETTKVKDAVKFVIDFTIVKNITAQTGERTVYVRILKPDGEVLTRDVSQTFAYENTRLEYSIRKQIEYTGEEQSVTVYWDIEEFLSAGTYTAYIFADGVMIGERDFTLN